MIRTRSGYSNTGSPLRRWLHISPARILRHLQSDYLPFWPRRPNFPGLKSPKLARCPASGPLKKAIVVKSRPDNSGHSAYRVVDHNEFSGCDRAHKMPRIGRDNADDPRYHAFHNAINSNLQFAFSDFVHFFFRMRVFVNYSTGLKFVMGEGHAERIEIATMPSR
jgi:hypothetical protein